MAKLSIEKGYMGRREIVWRMDANDAEALADELSQRRRQGWGDDADELYRLVDQLRPAAPAAHAEARDEDANG